METSSLIQKELLELSPQTDAAASASFNETDPIDETLTLFELFLIKIQSKKYGDALQIASEILKTDPRNPLILEYVPLLKEKMMLDLKEAEEEDEEGDSDEDEDEDSDDDDNDDEDIDTSDDSENDSDDSDSDDTDLSEEDELNTSGGQ
ncbi:hypothetical protein BCR33DRAFT_712430 [Rhizoclosmatium globosum]|uniref:TPR-like protein n=1 Tax=Rhizoclosmatium globosum TaxID=329046 RepID=A0A1Y2CWE9_9FUNG|nr:hypothetical protein HDU99_002334 [Rhizoclosmatium hyalinum]ORY51350.1 hypothetical protein BCR33DRAFT_712430 [Rhizoclosmatium globosum]|eukprot:ORY51350.1 hypothetical protein BCR33DRAFT_712430 [Rhizoclosmatium globosum]